MSTPQDAAHEFRCRLVWTGATKGATLDADTFSRDCRIDAEGKAHSISGTSAPAFHGDPARWNPEEMLVASLSACHFLTYAALCARARIALVAYEDDAWGTMQKVGGRIRFTEVVLRPRATIAAGDVARALALHEKANEHCIIANSVDFPVRHEPVIRVSGPA